MLDFKTAAWSNIESSVWESEAQNFTSTVQSKNSQQWLYEHWGSPSPLWWASPLHCIECLAVSWPLLDVVYSALLPRKQQMFLFSAHRQEVEGGRLALGHCSRVRLPGNRSKFRTQVRRINKHPTIPGRRERIRDILIENGFTYIGHLGDFKNFKKNSLIWK